jgi:hypothetical protein
MSRVACRFMRSFTRSCDEPITLRSMSVLDAWYLRFILIDSELKFCQHQPSSDSSRMPFRFITVKFGARGVFIGELGAGSKIRLRWTEEGERMRMWV